MLCVIYWLNQGCLSQFRLQGFSTLSARICNLHDHSREPVESPLDSALELPQRCYGCCSFITKRSTPVVKKIWYPRHVYNDMYVWLLAVTAEGDGAVVIRFLQTHRRWYKRGGRVERKTFIRSSPYKWFVLIAREKDQWSGVAFHFNHNNGVSAIIIPQSEWVPFLSFPYPYQLWMPLRVWTSMPWKPHQTYA